MCCTRFLGLQGYTLWKGAFTHTSFSLSSIHSSRKEKEGHKTYKKYAQLLCHCVALSSLPIVFRWQGAKFQTKPSRWKTFEIMRKVAYETSSIVFNLYDNQLYFRLACMLKLLERHSINLLRSKFSSPLFDSCQNYLRE